MTRYHAKLSQFILLSALLVPIQASAQLLLDQALSGSMGGGAELGAASRQPLDNNLVVQHLQQSGYSNVSPTPGNPHQFTATAPDGTASTLIVEPTTGQILSIVAQ